MMDTDNTQTEQQEQNNRLKEAEAKLEDSENKLQEQAGLIAELEAEIEALSAEEKVCEKNMTRMFAEIIQIRDSLLTKRDYLNEMDENEASAASRVVEALLKETANALKNCGVDIIEDKGEFSCQRQTVIDVIETEDDSLDDHIAEVVRPGYCYNGEQLRGQEVIIYKKKK